MNVCVQEVFTKVIAAGIYPKQTAFMCPALTTAYRTNVIEWDEFEAAKSAIKEYIGHLNGAPECGGGTLAGALTIAFGHVYVTPSTCLNIYFDWASRPMLPQGEECV